jgi:propanol-preferring alcohol dehydrogenase
MRALQYREIGAEPVIVETPIPEPGPGQVLVRVTAAGLCHSDLAVMGWGVDRFPYDLPLVLGHEAAGVVAACGPGVSAVAVGEAVVVYAAWGCGMCSMCAAGKENYCLRASALGICPPGLGRPGALAEYLLVDDARHLVPIGGLDPRRAAPLTDAALTPYHAIRPVLPRLAPGEVAIVIGVGGLGHLAIQMLRQLSGATIVAMDIHPAKLDLARAVGAHEVLNPGSQAVERIRDLAGIRGAAAVFDFVGTQSTVDLAAAVTGPESDIVVVGLHDHASSVRIGALARDAAVRRPYWGSRAELIEVLNLARKELIDVHVETFSLDEAPEAYRRLRHGEVIGRAVVLFET